MVNLALDHDLTLTAEQDMCRECGVQPVSCCDYFHEQKNYTTDQMPDNCWPIPIVANDPVFVGKTNYLYKISNRSPDGLQVVSRRSSSTQREKSKIFLSD